MVNYEAALLKCKRCNGIWVADKDNMKYCDYCEAKWNHEILWEADTGVPY